MFENLQEGLQSAFKSLRGKGKMTEANMREGLRSVEESLLEADVSYDAIQAFMDQVTEKALGQRVLLSLDPSQQVVAIVRDELISLLGPVDPRVHLRGDVTVIMLCGLQGSGKTTTCGKLAKLIKEGGARPLLVAADLQRPAAIEQLHVVGDQVGVPVYSDRRSVVYGLSEQGLSVDEIARRVKATTAEVEADLKQKGTDAGQLDPVKVCQEGVKRAREEDANVVILDTAGRLAIDQELMGQLQRIDRLVQPQQVYFVVDGMTGQDAVNSAKAFNDALELDGVIMTKLDGDARGGALLSVKHVTGVPIKFIGTGEHLDALEPFRPEGMANRILGMGDVLGLVDAARKVVDEKQQAELEKKLAAGQFTLDDFKDQMVKMAQPGLMKKMLGMFGGPMAEMNKMMEDEDTEGGIRRMVGIINSMTLSERKNTKLIDPSRRNRIARGAGVPANEVNQLVRQYEQMKPLMEGMAGKGMADRMRELRKLQEGGMLDPGSKGPRFKKGTGKRLTADERKKMKKQRDKEMRRKKRDKGQRKPEKGPTGERDNHPRREGPPNKKDKNDDGNKKDKNDDGRGRDPS